MLLKFDSGVFLAILVAVFVMVLVFAPRRLRELLHRATLIVLLVVCAGLFVVGWVMGHSFYIGSPATETTLKTGTIYEVIAKSPEETGKPLARAFIVVRDHQGDGSDIRLVEATRSYPWLFSIEESGGLRTIATRPLSPHEHDESGAAEPPP